MERLKAIAREALDTFEAIAIAARGSLGGRGITLNCKRRPQATRAL
jgi:hypothetical protein